MIRPGLVSDLPELMRIRTSVAENHLTREQMAEIGITDEVIAADMADGHLACWVAVEGTAIAGFAIADRRDGCVFALFMDRAHEGKGLGSALLARCEAWIAENGHATARLTTGRGTRALDFYLRRGWRETDETEPLFPDDAVLAKSL